MQPTAYVVHGIRMRHCHYCSNPIATAFYLPAPIRGWACAPCYTEHVIVPAVQPKQANCATDMALPEHVDAGLEGTNQGAITQSTTSHMTTTQGPRLQSTQDQPTSAAKADLVQLGVPSPVSAVA